MAGENRTQECWEALLAQAEALTKKYPPGTPCSYWTGSKFWSPRPSRIRSSFMVLSHLEIVVMVEGWRQPIPGTHVLVKEATCLPEPVFGNGDPG